jgi:hypothetical protein
MMMSSKKSKGTHKMGGNMCMSAIDVETIMSTMRRSPSIRRWREWSRRQDDSSKKYR